MRHVIPHDACTACAILAGPRLGRRSLLGLAGAAAIGGRAWAAEAGKAATGKYEAMLLSCIDPRVVDPVYEYMRRHELYGRYSQFVFAGAAIGAEAPRFAAWHQTFWDNLATSVELHGIRTVIAIDHRDCGAARLAYGPASVATPEAETETHRRVLAQFARDVARRHPDLRVQTGLMALDGTMEIFS
jgi:carbonic anhydrase